MQVKQSFMITHTKRYGLLVTRKSFLPAATKRSKNLRMSWFCCKYSDTFCSTIPCIIGCPLCTELCGNSSYTPDYTWFKAATNPFH